MHYDHPASPLCLITAFVFLFLSEINLNPCFLSALLPEALGIMGRPPAFTISFYAKARKVGGLCSDIGNARAGNSKAVPSTKDQPGASACSLA